MQHLKPSNLATTLHRHPKIIFLDVDGVLNRGFDVDQNNEIERKRCLYLAYLVYKTKAKIVVHSSWKYHKSMLNKLKKELRKYGLHIYDVTPTIYGKRAGRANEICDWMETHSFDRKHWVVLDDWDYSLVFKDHMVRTWSDGHYGLCTKYIRQALKVLES